MNDNEQYDNGTGKHKVATHGYHSTKLDKNRTIRQHREGLKTDLTGLDERKNRTIDRNSNRSADRMAHRPVEQTSSRSSGRTSETIDAHRSASHRRPSNSAQSTHYNNSRSAAARRKRELYRRKKRRLLYMRMALLSSICVLLLAVVIITIKKSVSTDKETVVKANVEDEIKSVLTGVADDSVLVSQYYTYGTHLNITGTVSPTSEVQTMQLVLVDDKKGLSDKNNAAKAAQSTESSTESNEDEYEKIYTLNKTVAGDGSYTFATADNIDEGICLENISDGNYCLLMKLIYTNGTSEYKSLQNTAGEEPITYYTITNKGTNQKIDISFDQDKDKTNLNYLSFTVAKSTLPDDVYDITIDAGHGGKDPGSDGGGYTEAELTLKYAKALKESLEKTGLKVKLSRDGSEPTDSDMAYNMYDEDGRVSITCRSQAKYCICIHLNSNEAKLTRGGVEVYSTIRGNGTFAKLVADQIVSNGNTDYSHKESEKVADGVYESPYSENGIEKSVATAAKHGYEPYDYDGVDSLFMIREVGGIATGAFVDGRDTRYGSNEYRNSNVGVETLLVELGYISISEDLKNIISNQDGYIKGMTDAVTQQIESLKNS